MVIAFSLVLSTLVILHRAIGYRNKELEESSLRRNILDMDPMNGFFTSDSVVSSWKRR